jgi:hypothetical protein
LIFGSAVAIDLFMKSLLAFFVMGFGWAVSGCFGCNAADCADGVQITMKGVAVKYAGLLPLDIKTCGDDGSCDVVKVSEAGGVFACDTVSSSSFASCFVTPAGDVTFHHSLVEIPESEVAAITVTVRDSANTTMFETTQNVALHDIEINGPGCGVTCQSGGALFVP